MSVLPVALMRKQWFCVMTLLVGLLCATSAQASPSLAGVVESIKGVSGAQAQLPDSVLRELDEGSDVYSGDRIKTGVDVTVFIRFNDGAEFVVAADSEMVIDQYRFNRVEEDAFHTRIIKGAFRFVSGLIAKKGPDTMSVNLVVGTLGIRGTAVMGEVKAREEQDGKVIEASARVMLMEPEDDKPTSIIVANRYGSVVVDEPGYGTEIPDEHSPPSPVRKMQLNTINNILRAIRSAPRRINTAKPRIP